MDGIVRQRLAEKAGAGDDAELDCVIDILNDFDVYKNNVERISNEILSSMFASTDTTRHNTTIAMCHLIKNSQSRNKVREEIEKFCLSKNTPNVQLLNPKTEELGQFKYLKYCINESLRFSPPAQIMDNYRLLQEVKIDSYTFRKDEQIKFYIYGLHHNPNEW